MKNRNMRYLTREGIKNVGANRLMTVASVAVLMSCLVIIGCAVLLYFNMDALLQNIESQNVIMTFVAEGAEDSVVKEVQGALEQLDNVQNVRFISSEEAFKTVEASLGENASVLRGVDNAFLPDGFEVTVADMQAFAETVAAVKEIPGVESVRENTDMAKRLERVRTAVTYVSLGIIALLFIVSIFIIANTVRITMFNRRLEISIMKAVGATNGFIRWPFMIEGISIGVISAVLSVGVLCLIYYLSSDALLAIFGMLGGGLVSFWLYAPYIFAAYLCVSVFTGGIGSMISIGRYLKEQGSVVDAN